MPKELMTFLIVFLVTVLLTTVMICYVILMYVFNLAKQYRVPTKSKDSGISLVIVIVWLLPGINVLFALLLAVAMSSPKLMSGVIFTSDLMTIEEMQQFDKDPTLKTAWQINKNHKRPGGAE